MNISLREANESQYWLDLLHKVEYISDTQYKSLYDDSTELCKLLMSIVRTTKERGLKDTIIKNNNNKG